MFENYFWILVVVLSAILFLLVLRKILRSSLEIDLYMEGLKTDPQEPEKVELTDHELRELIPTEILIEAQRSNTASGMVVEESDSEFPGKEIDEVLSSGIRIKIKGKGGTRGPKVKAKTPKERFDVDVSNLRRYFYNKGVSTEDAEKAIDLYLLDKEAFDKFGYIKSQRRMPPGGYAPM
jgi:hypothetical protein